MPLALWLLVSGGTAKSSSPRGEPVSFDGIARHYRWLEAVLAAGVLQRCRTTFLDQVRETKSALLLGEGNGRFLCPFLEASPIARVVCVEASEQMILQAKKAVDRRGIDPNRITFIRQDALDWTPTEGAFDLIVTHFFLDCFTLPQLQRLIPRLTRAATSDCTWLLADFQLPNRGWKRIRARVVHKLMYAFFRAVTRLPARRWTPPDSLLRENGFECTERVTAQWELVRSDCWVRSRP